LNDNAIKMTFKDIKYQVTIPTTKEEKANGMGATKEFQVLKGCTGYALPGQSLYIMGSSGAGKTSLLNALSDRITKKAGMSLTGDIMLNDDTPLTGPTFAKYGSYVMQDDCIFGYFTVREALTFAARLKLSTVPHEEQD